MKALAFAAKAFISGLLLFMAIRLVDINELQQRLYRLDAAWIVAAQTTLIIQILLASERWRAIAVRCGAKLSILQAVRFTLIGAFFSQTLPSTIGGDAARIWLLARATGHSKPAIYSVLVDRAAGLIWLAVIVLLCLPWSLSEIKNPLGRTTLILIGAAGVAGPLLLFVLTRIGRNLLVRWRITRYFSEISQTAWTTLTSARAGGTVAMTSVLIHLMSILAAWFIAKGIASPLEITQSILLIPPVILVSAIPISIAGWGVRESAMIAAFSYAGLPDGDGLAISVLFGAATFALGATGGMVWLLSRNKISSSEAR